jgi:hypothetical protein
MAHKLLLFAFLSLTFCGISRADTLYFRLQGDENASFELSSTPVNSHLGDVGVENVAVTDAFGTTLQTVTFFSEAFLGGVSDRTNTGGWVGPQIYSGTLAAPIFAPGFFLMTDISPTGPFDETLTISATPEPSSFTLLFSGLAVAGAAARRKNWLTHARST